MTSWKHITKVVAVFVSLGKFMCHVHNSLIIGLVTDGEFNSLRSRGATRPLSVLQIRSDSRNKFAKLSMTTMQGMITITGLWYLQLHCTFITSCPACQCQVEHILSPFIQEYLQVVPFKLWSLIRVCLSTSSKKFYCCSAMDTPSWKQLTT